MAGNTFWDGAAAVFATRTLAEILDQVEKEFGGSTTVSAKADSEPTAAPQSSVDAFSVPIDSLETEDDVVFHLDVPGELRWTLQNSLFNPTVWLIAA